MALFRKRCFPFQGRCGQNRYHAHSAAGKNSEGILDHIYARAIVIDNGATHAALFSADVGMLGEQVWRNLSQRIEKELGIPAQNLL